MASFTMDLDPYTSVLASTPKYAHKGTAPHAFTYAVNSGTGTAVVILQLMRAFDNTLGGSVYWYATTVDLTGAEYPGPGPLINVRWIKRKG